MQSRCQDHREQCHKRSASPNVAARNPIAYLLPAPLSFHHKNVHNTTIVHSASVELLQHLFHLGILLLHGHQRLLDSLQALCLVRFVGRALFILHLPVVLDLFAAVLDLGQAERSG